VFALAADDGRKLWEIRARAGINGCPSIAGGLVLIGAGAPRMDGVAAVPELTAYGLPGFGP
jgi:hypothetical protein